MSDSGEHARAAAGSQSQPSAGEGENKGANGAANGAASPREHEAPSDSQQHALQRTRTSGMWTAVAVAAIVLLLLLIFILQNLQSVTVSYFGAGGRLPLGVALLLAAVGGALIVLVLGVARILQLRRVARRQRRQQEAARSNR